MKKVIVIVVGLLSLLTSLYASRASFVVSNEELFYSYDTIVNESIAEDRIVNLELTNSDVVIFSDSTKSFTAKLVKTDQREIDALFTWGGIQQSNDVKLRYSINNSKPKNVKENQNQITLKNLPSNELSIFTLEANVNKKWIECGRVGLIPVNIIEDEVKVEQQEEVIEAIINEESSITTLEPKLISNTKVNRKVILSSYFISSLQILTFNSSTVNNGLGVKASVALPITNNLSFVTDVNYQWIKYTNRDFTELALMGKVRLNSNINDSGIVFIQLGAGENFVTKNSLNAYYPIVSTGLGLELYFTKSIALSFLGEYSVSFQRDSFNNHISGAVGLSIAFGKEAKVWRSLF